MGKYSLLVSAGNCSEMNGVVCGLKTPCTLLLPKKSGLVCKLNPHVKTMNTIFVFC